MITFQGSKHLQIYQPSDHSGVLVYVELSGKTVRLSHDLLPWLKSIDEQPSLNKKSVMRDLNTIDGAKFDALWQTLISEHVLVEVDPD
jgi:hypothetical protein